MTTIAKECRKALTTSFGQTHKGVPFDSIQATMRKEIEAWFAERDTNITLRYEKSSIGRPGEILITYSGATKDARFKFYVDGVFSLAGSSTDAPAYLKTINVRVDKRDFTK